MPAKLYEEPLTEAEKFARYYATPKGRVAHMLNNARARARRDGVRCTLTREFLAELLSPGVCQVTGLQLTWEAGYGKGHRMNPFAPSLDRIDPKGHYSPKNVRVVCWIYNRARGAFPDSALWAMARGMTRRKRAAA